MRWLRRYYRQNVRPDDTRDALVAAARERPARAPGGAGGAALALTGARPQTAGALLWLGLRGYLLLLPAVTAVRLWRDGKRRAALTLALAATARRFCDRWWQYLTIPLAAGAVGWVTNKVAVEMIFYPIEYFGVALRRWVNQPLGVVGWQGIVPCKAGVMAERLVDMITTRLLDCLLYTSPSPRDRG